MKTIQLSFIILFILIIQSCSSQNEVYVPYKKNLTWGFADTTGTLIIAPKYDSVGEYKDGYFTVRMGRVWGIINRENELLINYKYSNIQIEKGLFIVENRIGKKGVINANNDLLVDHEEQEITVENSHIVVKPKSKRKTIYNRLGKKVLPTGAILHKLFEFESETYFIFQHNSSSGLGKILNTPTQSNKIIIDTGQNRRFKFSNDKKFISVTKNIGDTNMPFLYKTEDILSNKPLETTLKNKEIAQMNLPLYTKHFKPPPSKIFSNTSNEASRKYFRIRNAPYWKLDTARIGDFYHLVFQKIQWPDDYGKIIMHQDTLPSQYKAASLIRIGTPRLCSALCLNIYNNYDTLQANFALLTNRKGLKGIKDAKLKTLIPFEYEEINPVYFEYECKEPLFICKKDGRWGIINISNQTLINFSYDEIKRHSYLVNHSSQLKCFDFSQGLIVKKDGKYGLIDGTEKRLVPFIFDAISYNPMEYSFSLEKDNKFGLFVNGIYLQPKYDYQIIGIKTINGYDLLKSKPGENYYVDYKGFSYFESNKVNR